MHRVTYLGLCTFSATAAVAHAAMSPKQSKRRIHVKLIIEAEKAARQNRSWRTKDQIHLTTEYYFASAEVLQAI